MIRWLPVLAGVCGAALLLARISEVLYKNTTALQVSRRDPLWLAGGLLLLCCGVWGRGIPLTWRLIVGLGGLASAGAPFCWRQGRTQERNTAERVAERTVLWRWAYWVPLGGMLLVAPALWFPSVRPELTVLALGLYVLLPIGAVALGLSVWPRSEIDGALVVSLLAAVVGAVSSEQAELTLPKVTSLLLGVGVYYALLQLPKKVASRTILTVLTALASLFVLVGLTNGLSPSKVGALAVVRDYVPKILAELPDTQNGLVSMNQLGGSLLWVVPVLLALCLGRNEGDQRLSALARLLALLSGSLLLAAVVLTQSRGAWGGLLVGGAVVLALSRLWGRWAVGLGIVTALLFWLLWGRQHLGAAITQVVLGPGGLVTSVGALSVIGRLEIGRGVLACLTSHPWTGCGWGTLRGTSFTHAHNALLQVGYDMGVPGLVAYLAVVIVALRRCVRALRGPGGLQRHLAVGSLGALAAYHVYGIVDVVALGSKPGVLWWCLLALIMATATGPGDKLLADKQQRSVQCERGAIEPAEPRQGERETDRRGPLGQSK